MNQVQVPLSVAMVYILASLERQWSYLPTLLSTVIGALR